MEKIKYLNIKQLIALFLAFSLTLPGLSQSNSIIKCPIVIGARGAQILISFSSAKKICNNRVKYVNIEKMSGSPAYAYDLYKNAYEATKNDSMILVSKASSKYFSAPGGGMRFLLFKGNGENSFWIGKENYYGKYYTMKKDSSLQLIGFEEKSYRRTPEGMNILMTKGTGAQDYFAGSSNGKIYKLKGTNEVVQIGTFAFFWMPPDQKSGLQRAIVMTKGMGANDKWCGEQDGIIYIKK